MFKRLSSLLPLLFLVRSANAKCCVQHSAHSLPDTPDTPDLSLCPRIDDFLYARTPPRSCDGTCTPYNPPAGSGVTPIGHIGYSLESSGSEVTYLCCKLPTSTIVGPLVPPADGFFLPPPTPEPCPHRCFTNRTVLDEALMKYRAAEVESVYGPIEEWCFDGIEDFSYLFFFKRTFNENITGWDVSGVKNMNKMFYFADVFNQTIGGWNVSQVTNMNGMFLRAQKFNSYIGDWDTSQVYDMIGMFQQAYQFNQPIGKWNTTKVYDMRNMFYLAVRFNQPIGNWDTSNCGYFRNMFNNARVFNQDITRWNTTIVRSMRDMFQNNHEFNQDISVWNISKTSNLQDTFREARKFNQNLCAWGPQMRTGLRVIRYANLTFVNSSCPEQGDPDTGLGVDPITPLCYACT